jgi:hypothetical protein
MLIACERSDDQVSTLLQLRERAVRVPEACEPRHDLSATRFSVAASWFSST